MDSEQQPEPGSGGRYTRVRELGRGSTAVVDLLYDGTRRTSVACKRMISLDAENRFRLKQEFRRAREVQHPNLVRLYDLVVTGDETFFTMEPVLGVDIAAYVRRVTEARPASEVAGAHIAHLLRQLADAVRALHAAGIVHRDLKPSNVLVEKNGRVVLLDFGLASPLDGVLTASEDRGLVGTIPFMAPECLWGALPSTSSDWYSFGAIAAELYLGRPLFSGSLQALIREKDRPPTTLRAQAPDIPSALDGLICALLQREASARPNPAQIERVLAELGGSLPAVASARTAFVGRATELAALEASIGSEARAQVVGIVGPSGIGKTTLARELLARLESRPGWSVFRGRCHPNEHVTFKALDAVMDELSGYLKQAGPRLRARIAALPGITALCQVFPVLTRLEELSTAAAAGETSADAQRRWVEAVHAFRALWTALSEAERVVVWIDDLQWADRDGLKLLRELIAIEPRPKITWILSQTSDELLRRERSGLELLCRDVSDVHEHPITALCAADARELARSGGAPEDLLDAIVSQSDGSPFLIGELTRRAVSHGELASLGTIVDERMHDLEPAALALLEQLAVAGGPLPARALRALLGPDFELDQSLDNLERAWLVRLSDSGDGEQLAEVYHERVRSLVMERMNAGARTEIHLRLAEAMSLLPEVSRAALALHFERGGDRVRALAATLEAADDSTRLLAFEEAARLHLRALELGPQPASVELCERAALAVSRAGRCAEAAELFLRAAQQARDERQREALQLQAGVHLLYAGRIERGRSTLQDVLRARGIAWPKSPTLFAAMERGRFLLTGRKRSPETREPPSPDAVLRFDALWAVAKGTVMVEHVAGDALALRALREAIRLGDPSRLSWALGAEAGSEANLGGPLLHWRARALISEVERLAAQTGSMFDLAYARMSKGIVAWFQGEWVPAVQHLRDADQQLARLARHGAHERDVIGAFLIGALEAQGKIAELTELVTSLRASAEQTGDLYASFVYKAGAASVLLHAADRPLEAIREADEALAAWSMTEFTSQHFNHFVVTCWARLYGGLIEEAWEQVERTWPQLERAHFLRLDALSLVSRLLRGRAALMIAPSTRNPRKLFDLARKEAAAIGRSSLPHAAPFRDTIEYGVAAKTGDLQKARALCESTLIGYDHAGMWMLRECARLRLATLDPDPARCAMHDAEARAWLQRAGVRNGDAMLAACMPAP